MLRQYHIRLTCISWFNPSNYTIRIMNSTEFNNFIFVKLFLLYDNKNKYSQNQESTKC
jgi:hypothetical protein